jgi:uncharacterized membrane protein
MRRINLFLILTIVSVASLIAIFAAGYVALTAGASSSTTPSNLVGQMVGGMGGMMGGTTTANQGQTQNSLSPYFGVAFIALVGVAIVGVVGLVYFVVFPEIRNRAISTQPLVPQTTVLPVDGIPKESEAAPIDSVVKTLSVEERKVVEVLTAHEGKYLQKYIRSETGFSRLQTHRIVARLAERGIVTLEKIGNTNSVKLASWLL